jgi:DNA gyrase/topoisomerase IV subunit B
MYIGTDGTETTREYILNVDKNIVLEETFTGATVIKSLFNRVLDNACESNVMLITKNIDSGNIDSGNILTGQNIFTKPIEVTVHENVINIKNYGVNIPIMSHNNIPPFGLINHATDQGDQDYYPELIFGARLTGGNYRGPGVNTGGSVKYVNAFSKLFKITICNTFERKKYKQIWCENMKIKHEPLIENYFETESYVKVKYIMDFERFNLQHTYTNDMISLLAYTVASKSYLCEMPIIFNDRIINMSIDEYTKLHIGDFVPSMFMHTQDDLTLCVCDTPNKGKILSFVNGVLTKEGGVHVDAIFRHVGEQFNIDVNLKNKIQYFNKHLTVIIKFAANNPTFSSQLKLSLASPVPKINIDESIISNHIRHKTIPSIIKAAPMGITVMMLLCAKWDCDFNNIFSIIPHDIVNNIAQVLILNEWHDQLQIMQGYK